MKVDNRKAVRETFNKNSNNTLVLMTELNRVKLRQRSIGAGYLELPKGINESGGQSKTTTFFNTSWF